VVDLRVGGGLENCCRQHVMRSGSERPTVSRGAATAVPVIASMPGLSGEL